MKSYTRRFEINKLSKFYLLVGIVGWDMSELSSERIFPFKTLYVTNSGKSMFEML